MTGSGHVLVVSLAPQREPPVGLARAVGHLGANVALVAAGAPTDAGPAVEIGARVGASLVAPAADVVPVAGGWDIRVDDVGAFHLYERHGPGWAAVSTSATALARLEPTVLDETSLAQLAVLGHHHGTATVHRGVAKLAAGTRARLAAGRLVVHATAPTPARREGDGTAADAASVLTGCVADVLAGRPALVELSGGLDSRLIAAALDPDLRRASTAFTIGDDADDDVVVARQVAARLGLAHDVVSLRSCCPSDPDDARRQAERAGWSVDWAGNAVAIAALDAVEARVDQGRRLTGQNGEFGRGFYYALQPPGPVTRHRAAMLARWRVLVNDRVDPGVLQADVERDAEHALVHAIVDELGASGLPYLDATDELYLSLRMQHWVGPVHSAALRDRVVLAPFFHPRYLHWCRSLRSGDRRGSRALVAGLHELDPRLASLRLAGGAAPGDGPSVAAAARKVVGKVQQRLQQRAKPAFATDTFASLVQRSWVGQPGSLAHALASPLVDPDVVGEIAAGRRPASPATVGFLVGLDALQREAASAVHRSSTPHVPAGTGPGLP